MTEPCRKSPIGRKDGWVDVEPKQPSQLELVDLLIFADQDQSWTGTMVTAEITCPGMRKNFKVEFPNGKTKKVFNTAGVALGNFRGTAHFSWPNGQRLTVTFNYKIVR
jgi:hypothetical protein